MFACLPAGRPSDPRLCRALRAWPTRAAFIRAGSASKLATPSQTRPRSDGLGWGGATCFGRFCEKADRAGVWHRRPTNEPRITNLSACGTHRQATRSSLPASEAEATDQACLGRRHCRSTPLDARRPRQAAGVGQTADLWGDVQSIFLSAQIGEISGKNHPIDIQSTMAHLFSVAWRKCRTSRDRGLPLRSPIGSTYRADTTWMWQKMPCRQRWRERYTRWRPVHRARLVGGSSWSVVSGVMGLAL